ncbi:twin-arginine translocation pathway signal protein [Paracraurococcus ruber]|nr:tripartite tricarboxylate transporter substrate-binding protein [Paracraurococcus ruber]TDG30154.1 twin-arginine translocation pathway signal protein [Paracraurococcus ruber]
MTHPRLGRRTVLSAAVAAACPAPSRAQPRTPDLVKLVVGLPPGSLPDVIARTLAPHLAGRIAPAVVVENRLGAGARLAVDSVLQGPRDGSQVLVTPSGVLTLAPHTFRTLSYRPFQDLQPVSLLGRAGFSFCVGPLVDPSVRTLRDFADWCRAHPAQASYASLAAGSPPHFVGEMLKRALQFDCTHVAGRNDPAPEVLGGQIAAMSKGSVDVSRLAGDPRLRVLANTGSARWPHMPDTPTFAEQGVPDLDWLDWYGAYVPAGVPPGLAAKLSEAIGAAFGDPRFLEQWRTALLIAPEASKPEELDRLGRADLERWAGVVRVTGFVAE